jgi:L-ascorbate metabolism protein UlaG (beta-lactamase superfamily)
VVGKTRWAILCLGAAFLSIAVHSHVAERPRLSFIGHATVLLEGTEATLLTDPFFKPKMLWLRRRVLPSRTPAELPPVDVVLISHTHPDHFDPDAIRALTPRPVLVMPWGRGRRLRKQGFTVVDLKPGESWNCKNVKITAVKARHNAWHNVGYLIEMDGTKTYFTGDSKLFNGLKNLAGENIDFMLMPYAGTPVIGNIWTLRQAARAVSWVKPKAVVPIHMETFGHWITGKPSVGPEVFQNLLGTVTPETVCRLLRPGESLTMVLNRED